MKFDYYFFLCWIVFSCTHKPFNLDNNPPKINSIESSSNEVITGGDLYLNVNAVDVDNDSLEYDWLASSGSIIGKGAAIKWRAPFAEGNEVISVKVTDTMNESDEKEISINVIEPFPNNIFPAIQSLTVEKDTVLGGEEISVEVAATDQDNDPLTYFWTTSAGSFLGNGTLVTWMAPDIQQQSSREEIRIVVNDGKGGSTSKRRYITVKSRLPLPQITSIEASPQEISLSGQVNLTVTASSPTGSDLSYEWSSIGGSFSGQGSSVAWTAPSGPICCALGPYELNVKVRNEEGSESEAKIIVNVTL
jgi:Big-like domain-containing protein